MARLFGRPDTLDRVRATELQSVQARRRAGNVRRHAEANLDTVSADYKAMDEALRN